MRLLTQAAQDVLAERRRQIDGEGWTPEHDDEHNHSDLARAAACYALMAAGWRADGETISQHWPWMSRPKPSQGPRRDLVKAGALILAEIERLDRAIRAKPEPCTKCGNVPPACSGPNEPHISTSCADCGAVFYTSAARAMHICLDPKVAARYIERLRQMNADKNARIEELEAECDALQAQSKGSQPDPWGAQAMSEWRQIVSFATVQAHRAGWLGVWDTLKAAITRRPRQTVPTEMVSSVWVKATGGLDVKIETYGAKVEVRPSSSPSTSEGGQ